MKRALLVAGGVVLAGAVWWGRGATLPTAPAADGPPLEAATVEEHLGRSLPHGLRFRDEGGREVRLGELIAAPDGGGRPTILVLAYYGCRTLCPLVLEGTARSLAGVDRRLGEGYRALTVSIDARDTPAAAAEKQREVLAPLGALPAGAWPFLVGGEAEIQALAAALGFGYRYDRASDQFSHPAVIFALTPRGEISSYLYGIDPAPAEVERALEGAAAGETRATLERILLRCFHFIPALRQHAGLIRGLLRGGGALTVLALGLLLGRLWLRELRREGAQ
jgi:protein SCO1/2